MEESTMSGRVQNRKGRNFDGDKFRWHGDFSGKSHASNEAKKLRKKGQNVRRATNKDHKGRDVTSLYRRKR